MLESKEALLEQRRLGISAHVSVTALKLEKLKSLQPQSRVGVSTLTPYLSTFEGPLEWLKVRDGVRIL